jgi:hypothetical protein
MFRSRVQGVGTVPFVFDPGKTDWTKVIPQDPMTDGNKGIGGYKAQVCHPDSPAGTCKPVDWKPDAVTTTRAVEPPAKTDWLGIVIRAGSIYGLIKNLSK